MGDPRGKYTVTVESSSGSRLYQCDQLSWHDFQATTYLCLTLPDGSEFYINDFGIRAIHKVLNM